MIWYITLTSVKHFVPHFIKYGKIHLGTSVNLKVAAQPLSYFFLRISHKQSGLYLSTYC